MFELRHFQGVRNIARRRFFRPEQNYNRGPAINERIRSNPVRLIDENDNMVGVVSTIEALRRAFEAGLDLVEANPILDDRNTTANLGVELACSALGQKIL